MYDDLTRRVIAIIASTQHLPEENITPESTFAALGIDSLDGINILFALENEFNIDIPDDAAGQQMAKIADVVEGVRRLLEGGSASAAAPVA
jgi:acyl carrier protein